MSIASPDTALGRNLARLLRRPEATSIAPKVEPVEIGSRALAVVSYDNDYERLELERATQAAQIIASVQKDLLLWADKGKIVPSIRGINDDSKTHIIGRRSFFDGAVEVATYGRDQVRAEHLRAPQEPIVVYDGQIFIGVMAEWEQVGHEAGNDIFRLVPAMSDGKIVRHPLSPDEPVSIPNLYDTREAKQVFPLDKAREIKQIVDERLSPLMNPSDKS